MIPTLSKIRIYPIKSLDPVELTSVKIGIRSLSGDRRYAMLNQYGSFINGKATGLVSQLQTTFDETLENVTFKKRGTDDKAIFNSNSETAHTNPVTKLYPNKLMMTYNCPKCGRIDSNVQLINCPLVRLQSDS